MNYPPAQKREYDRIRRRKILAQIIEYLRHHPCVDCPEKDLVVLEFDHVRGKKFEGIAQMARGYTFKRILKEIRKCEVRCANCHKRRHAAKAQWGKYEAVV